MLVHTPKKLKGQQNLIPFFTLFQGGCVAGSVDLNAPFACYYATTLGCVVFNPDYMLTGRNYGATDNNRENNIEIDQVENNKDL